jgi:lipoyl(octanoyl) transferase
MMKALISQAINLNDYSLHESDLINLNERTVVVKKWNWDYELSHKFQREALKLVQESNKLRILICCSHPETLTNGRGLQKPKKGETLNLVEFKLQDHKSLPYPLFQIERGGGLTFHHPGQFIFYPILKLNPSTLSLSKMIDEIFDFSIAVLKSWGIENLSHENKLLGLWHNNYKLASMGIAIEKLTTFHGMALNIIGNKEMTKTLSGLNPCGLKAETYTSVDALTTLPRLPLETFCDDFLKRIQHEWK